MCACVRAWVGACACVLVRSPPPKARLPPPPPRRRAPQQASAAAATGQPRAKPRLAGRSAASAARPPPPYTRATHLARCRPPRRPRPPPRRAAAAAAPSAALPVSATAGGAAAPRASPQPTLGSPRVTSCSRWSSARTHRAPPNAAARVRPLQQLCRERLCGSKSRPSLRAASQLKAGQVLPRRQARMRVVRLASAPRPARARGRAQTRR